jgi:DtxR family transcriptional regulator, Mn-dependent transcriptional regulator
MISQAVQDYLKTIYKLQKKGPVPTTEIAMELDVSGASVTGMLKRLSGMGFVDYNSYKGVILTEKGEKIALHIIRHHRLLELYLKEMLGFSLDKVHDEACRLEHYISEEFSDKIDDLLGNPKFDPHGHPIPTKEGKIFALKEVPLSEAEIGVELTITRLSDNDPKFLNYLEQMDLMPNRNVKLLEIAPFNGPITIRHNGEDKIIGQELARNIYVEQL